MNGPIPFLDSKEQLRTPPRTASRGRPCRQACCRHVCEAKIPVVGFTMGDPAPFAPSESAAKYSPVRHGERRLHGVPPAPLRGYGDSRCRDARDQPSTGERTSQRTRSRGRGRRCSTASLAVPGGRCGRRLPRRTCRRRCGLGTAVGRSGTALAREEATAAEIIEAIMNGGACGARAPGSANFRRHNCR
jgi:hypothetical protein